MSGHETDSDESFHSFHDDKMTPPSSAPTFEQPSTATTKFPPPEHFSPAEEASLLSASNDLRISGNSHFGRGDYSSAIQTYDSALASCPNYLEYELAILRSNIAACHLKLEEWKEAVESAERGIDNLERLEPLPRSRPTAKTDGAAPQDEGSQNGNGNSGGGGVEEVDDKLEERLETLRQSGRSLDEVRKLQVKLVLRRARAKTALGGWASLQGAQEDYNTLLLPAMLPCLSPADRRAINEAQHKLGPKLTEARDREMGEMMDKLKGLGNTILKPFGLSTDNFQFVQDQKTGGYSMNFNQNPGRSDG